MHCISRWILAVAACAICAMVAAPALAQDSVTLKRIKDKKTIVLGVREASVPFSYLDDKKQ